MAFQILRPLAEQGNAVAQNNLGIAASVQPRAEVGAAANFISPWRVSVAVAPRASGSQPGGVDAYRNNVA
jgi:hypothetical protein